MRSPIPLSLLILVALRAVPVQAQFDGGQASEPPGWAPVSVGAHTGYDNAQHGWVAGGFVGIPVMRNGLVELMPNFDVTFLEGFEEYQANLELVYLSGDRRGGIIAGGGMGFRNSVFGPDPDAERRTVTTFSVMLGARLGNLGRFRPQVETRWILQDEWARDPRQVMLGVGVSLWGP